MTPSTARFSRPTVALAAGQPDRFVNRAEFSGATFVPCEDLSKVLQQVEKIVAGRQEQLHLRSLVVVALLGFALVGAGAAIRSSGGGASLSDQDALGSAQSSAAHRDTNTPNLDSHVPATRFSVTIRRPSGPPRVSTGLKDFRGNEVTVACSTCHTTRPPNPQNRHATDLDEFHGDMEYSHGTISCQSCHNERDYDALRMADDRRVEFADVMSLCAQCHGPQMKSYEHGAHGGMNGYWDLNRGPRVKNNCIDCHDPHSPQFPKMRPTFKPQDRFLEPQRAEH